jgi:hypothetical protein
MTIPAPLRVAAALPLIALLAACVPGGAQVDSQQDMEATLDQDIDGDGTITSDIGVELPEED